MKVARLFALTVEMFPPPAYPTMIPALFVPKIVAPDSLMILVTLPVARTAGALGEVVESVTLSLLSSDPLAGISMPLVMFAAKAVPAGAAARASAEALAKRKVSRVRRAMDPPKQGVAFG